VKKGLSEIVLVLDRSGSMTTTKGDAEYGLREFIRKQRVLPGECLLTFYRFDDQIERVFEAKPLWSVEDSELRLEPRGSTALLDAMSRAIEEVGDRLSRRADYDRPEHVYVVTITDGYENASITSKKAVFDKIAHQRDKYQWEFVFIGANQDAIASAAQLGISPQYSLNYSGTGIGTQHAYAALHNTVKRGRTTGEVLCFTQEERTSAAEK
jgi:hypothetical protein